LPGSQTKKYFILVRMANTTSFTTTPQTTFPGPARDFSDFLDALKKYTIPDIEKLKEIALEHENQGLHDGGRCSTALAKLCFAVVEAVGLVLRSDLNTPGSYDNAIRNGNIENAIPFFSYAQQKGITTISNSKLKVIYILYRNKIIHSLFPKYGLGIAQNSTNGVVDAVIDIQGVKSLNVNWLSHTTLKVVHELDLETQNIQAPILITINNNISSIGAAEKRNINNEYASVRSAYPDFQNELLQIIPGLPLQ
jgi:hypothetical protein